MNGLLTGACMHAKSLQLCPTLCDPIDYSLPGFSVHGILQARILKWVAIPFPVELPDPGIEPCSPELQGDSLPSEPIQSIFKQKQTYILSASLFCTKVGLLHTLFVILSFLPSNVPWR